MKRFKGEPEIEDPTAFDDHVPEEEPPEIDGVFSERGESKVEDLFPVEHMQPLKGLMYLGHIEQEFEIAGHLFNIRTLREGEVLRIGQLIKPYEGTSTESRARKAMVVAASIQSVDGEPIISEYRSGYDTIYERFNVVRKWFPAVVAMVYEKYIGLEVAAIELTTSLKK